MKGWVALEGDILLGGMKKYIEMKQEIRGKNDGHLKRDHEHEQ